VLALEEGHPKIAQALFERGAAGQPGLPRVPERKRPHPLTLALAGILLCSNVAAENNRGQWSVPMKMKILTALAVLVFSGCASVQIPHQKIEKSEASIRAAQEAGAQEVPRAKYHLDLAKDETASARGMADNVNNRAEFLLDRALADSELALAIAREAAVRQAANRAFEDLQQLKE
jgi:hypothetical protein